jgi:hypothetical protein
MDEVLEQRRVDDGAELEFLAGDGRADDGEDAGTDDGADAEGGQRPRAERLFQAMLGFFGVRYEFVDRLLGEELRGQGNLRCSAISMQHVQPLLSPPRIDATKRQAASTASSYRAECRVLTA